MKARLLVFVITLSLVGYGGYILFEEPIAGVSMTGLGLFLGVTSVILFGASQTLAKYKQQLAELSIASKARPTFYVPRDMEKFLIQQKLYWIIKPLREQKWPWKKIVAYLQQNYPDYPSDPKTLLNALKAGDAGYLDSWPPNLEDPAKRENPSTNFGNS